MSRRELSFTNISDARKRLLHTKFCDVCCKILFESEEQARNYIGLILKRRNLYDGIFAIKPYRCQRGSRGWHVGRNTRTLRLNFTLGYIANHNAVKTGDQAVAPRKP